MTTDAKTHPQAPHRQLLFVLGSVWLMLAAYSLTSQKIDLFGLTLQKSEIRAYVTASSADADLPRERPARRSVLIPPQVALPEKTTAPAAATVTVPPSATARRIIDERPHKILTVGDSMVKILMPRLADCCLARGHELTPDMWYGSTTLDWSRSQKLDQLIRIHKPSYIFVALGSSELRARKVQQRAAWVRTIIDKIGELPFVWIGPPNWREDTGINDVIERVVGKERFFLSKHLKMKRTTDGIHPLPEDGARWMDLVAAWMVGHSAAPIVMKQPTRKAPRPHAILLHEQK